MNLMCLIYRKNNSDKIQKLKEKIITNNIKIEDIEKPTLVTSNNVYFLNSVPCIPKEKDVFTKWKEPTIMYVNWSNSSDIQISDLKRQWGFSVLVDNSDIKVPTKNAQTYTMVFDDEENCVKHLKWFNSCFHTSKEQKADKEQEEILKKQQKKNKKIQITRYI